MTARASAAPRAHWSPLEYVPSETVLQRLIDTAERRWSAERCEYDHDVTTLNDWLWDDAARTDGRRATSMIESANSLAYALGRVRPVVLIPHGARPTFSMVAPVDAPGGILGIGRAPVRAAVKPAPAQSMRCWQSTPFAKASTTRVGGSATGRGWPARAAANPKQKTPAGRWQRSWSSCSLRHDGRGAGPERSSARLPAGYLRD
jgi:hypothetical protein